MNLFVPYVMAASATACLFFALQAHNQKVEKVGLLAASTTTRGLLLMMAAVYAFHCQAVVFTQATSWTEAVLSTAGAVFALGTWLGVRKRLASGIPISGALAR